MRENLYQKDNFLIVPTHLVEQEVVEPTIRNINSMKIATVPKLTYIFDNTAMQKIFVYDIGSNKFLIPFNSQKATDRAKSEFYDDIKKIVEEKCIDFENIIDTTKWFQNNDGTKIFILNQNIGGYLTNDKIETVKKQIFDILFNN